MTIHLIEHLNQSSSHLKTIYLNENETGRMNTLGQKNKSRGTFSTKTVSPELLLVRNHGVFPRVSAQQYLLPDPIGERTVNAFHLRPQPLAGGSVG
jgi:hypothetical protein